MNANGQLADGSTSTRTAPVAVNIGASSALYGKTVAYVDCGASTCHAITNENNVMVGWGLNYNGLTFTKYIYNYRTFGRYYKHCENPSYPRR